MFINAGFWYPGTTNSSGQSVNPCGSLFHVVSRGCDDW